jgi:uncharacterized protein YcbX
MAGAAAVLELWRYPVKSMRGERLDGAHICERGMDGDRTHAVHDQETGRIASAKYPRKWGALLWCAARVSSPWGTVSIVLPDGREVTAGDDDADDVNAALSMLTNRAVQLVDVTPDPPQIERYWPDVDGLAQRNTVTSNVLAQGVPGGTGTFVDYAPLHLLTTATLAALSALYPSGVPDTRRFRPNLVLETPEAAHGFVENDWVGCTIQIGREVRLRITNPAPRCVVPTLPQEQLAGDIGILRTIAAHNRPPVPALGNVRLPCLGVYACVERGGVVRVGDTVWVADAGEARCS